MTKETMRAMFIDTLKEHNKVFDSFDASNEKFIKLSWTGKNGHDFDVFVCFILQDDGTAYVGLNCYDFPSFAQNLQTGLRLCNQLSSENFVKYYIDDELDAVSEIVIPFHYKGIPAAYSPELVLSYATLLAVNAEEAYPILHNA